MTKIVDLHDDDMIFLDVLPELHPDFIEQVRKSRQTFPPSKSQNDGSPTK